MIEAIDLPVRRPVLRLPRLLRAAGLAGLWLGLASGADAAALKGMARPPALPPEAERLRLSGTADVPVAVAARAVEANGTTRLSIDLSRTVAVNAYLLDKPDRVVVDLPEVNFQIDPAAARLPGKGVGVVKSFRFGLFAPGRSRIVIDLGAPAVLRKAMVQPIAGGDPARLLIELARSDRVSFHAAVRHGDPAPSSPAPSGPGPSGVEGVGPGSSGPAPADVSSSRDGSAGLVAAAGPDTVAPALKLPVIVIDPGHGGVDPGATGAGGVPEKVVVFDFAAALAAKLTATGRYRVVLTRSDDSFVSLGDRVRVAREAGAALFISVHADTLSDPAVTGATVYTSSDRASDAEAARVAASENRSDEVAGLEAAPDSPGVNDILFDLTRRETRTYAHLFQRTLVGYWEKIAHLNKNPQRSAGFKVLGAPDVPSVLLELGYLSSQADSRMLLSPDWRDRAADTVLTSVDSFFGRRQAPGPGPAPGKVVSAQSHL